MTLRCILVDDEKLARDRIRAMTRAEDDLEIVAECKDGVEAILACEEHQPDLLFLDVQMPRLDGFGVLAGLPEESLPAVIFTTAHDEHAVRAFEVHAVDYLLKPFTEARFRTAVARARDQLRGRLQTDGLHTLASQLRSAQAGARRILARSPDRVVFLKASEIDWVEAAGNYVVLHTSGERHITRETLSSMEKRLGDAGFMRVSRSSLVNLHRVRELLPLAETGQFCALLKSGMRVAITCGPREIQERIAKL